MKTKIKGKAILGLAMAAVMIASVIAVMIGSTGGALSKGDGYNYIEVPQTATQKVIIGQELQFVDTSGNPISEEVEVSRVVDWAEDWSIMSDSNGRLTVSEDESQWTKSGAFYVNYLDRYNWSSKLSVSSPSMPLKLKVDTKEVSSIAVGSPGFKIDVGGINLFDNDNVDLVVIGPDGQIKYDTQNNQKFTNITVSALKNTYEKQLITTGWDIGVYTFQVKTKSQNACGLEAESNVKELKLLKGEIAIEAETTDTVELRTVTLTVTGVAADMIKVEATPCEDAFFKAGIDDTPPGAGCSFTDEIDADGIRKYAIEFFDTGTFTIKVTVEGGPRAGDYDTVDIAVSEKKVEFDLPSTVVIGDRITIKGTADAGTYVSVYVDDTLYYPLRNLVLEDGEFEKEITTTDIGLNVPGTVTLKAWIDCSTSVGGVPPTTTPDGSTNVFLVEPWLTARLSQDAVDPEEEFTVFGSASGLTSVQIVCVPPKGGSGKSLTQDRKGITLISAGVSMTDGTYSRKLLVQEHATSGYYYILVLSPGMDGVWDMTYMSSLIGAIYERYNIQDITNPNYAGTKTQDEIIEIFEDLTQSVGSDDIMRIQTLKVGDVETLTLNPIADVVAGNNLEVTGTTSTRDGSIIWLTVKKPCYEIVPQAAVVKDNTFNASFDTTGAPPGTYTVKAIDGYGSTAVTGVNIITEAVVPTSFDTGEGSYPSIMGTHNGTITIQRMYT